MRWFSQYVKTESDYILQRCSFYLGEHGRSCFSLLLRGIVRHVWLKSVELCELICCEMSLDLLLVHHTEGQRLFCYLSIVNLLLHCALKDRSINARMHFNNVSNSRLRKEPCVRRQQFLVSPGRGTCTQTQSCAVQTGKPWRYSEHHRRGSTRRRRWSPG